MASSRGPRGARLLVLPLQLRQQRGDLPGPGGTQRVAQSDGAALGVHLADQLACSKVSPDPAIILRNPPNKSGAQKFQ